MSTLYIWSERSLFSSHADDKRDFIHTVSRDFPLIRVFIGYSRLPRADMFVKIMQVCH